MSLRVMSFGGGIQSVAYLVLAARGRIDFRTFLFANVGDDSKSPATLRYLHDVARPFAHAHGLALHELHRQRRDGSRETLYGRLTRAVALEKLFNERRARLRCSASGRPAAVYVIDAYTPATGAGLLGAETGTWRALEPGPQRCGACGQHVTVTPEGRWPTHQRGPVYLTRFGRPLDQAITEAQPCLFGPEGPETCDEGHCWT